MTIKEVEFQQQGWRFSVKRLYDKVALAITNAERPPHAFMMTCEESEWRRLCRESCGEPVTIRGFTTDDGLHVVQYHDGWLAIGENRKNTPAIKMMPAEWIRLWQCGAAGWQPGAPTEKYVPYAIEYRAYLPHRKVELRVFAGTLQRIIEDADPVLYAFGEDFPIANGPSEVTIPKADIVRHFRVPDPPKPEPVPEPPTWVRVEATEQNQVKSVGVKAWGFKVGTRGNERWAISGDWSEEINPNWALGCWKEIPA
jgi:hypothetical protein